MSVQEKRLEEKRVKYSGYSTEPDDYQSVDGAIAFASNATYEDGGIKGIPDSVRGRLVVAEGAQIYIHHTVNYYHYIIIYQCDGCVRLYVIDKENMDGYLNNTDAEHLYVDAICHHHGEVGPGEDYDMPDNMTDTVVEHLYTCEGNFVDIQAVANTLVVSTDEDMYYLLCKPGGVDDGQEALTTLCEHPYIYLGNKVPSVEISFALKNTIRQTTYDESNIELTDNDYSEGGLSGGTSMATLNFSYNSSEGVRHTYTFYFRDTVTITPTNSYDLVFYNLSTNAVSDLDTLELYGTREGESEPRLIFSHGSEGGGSLSRNHKFSIAYTYSSLYVVFGTRTDYGNNESSGHLSLRYYEQVGIGSGNTYPAYTEENYEAIMGYINKYVAEYGTNKNKFIHPFFVRYAVRLYDDTVCCVSPPILMVPNSGYAPFLLVGKETYEVEMYAFVADLQYKINTELGNNWVDIIQSVDIFVSQPIYPYDQGQGYDETENLFTYKDYGQYTKDYDDETGVRRSVDDFTGLSVGYGNLYTVEGEQIEEGYTHRDLYEWAKYVYGFTDTTMTDNTVWRITQIAAKDTDEIDKEICEVSNFYFLERINFEDLIKSEDFATLELTKGTLEGLVSRERLNEDVINYSSFVGSNLHSYNSRLHTYGGYLRYRDSEPLPSQCQYLNTYHYRDSKNCVVEYTFYEAWVYIKTSEGTKVAHTTYDSNVWYGGGYVCYYGGMVWFFYPNNRAYKVVIKCNRGGEGVVYITLALKEHDFLSGAYFFLRTEYGLWDDGFASMISHDGPTGYRENYESQSIYVSEVGNPFTFRNSTAVTVGSGQVLALSSAAQAMSQGQFGQYPLYVFTDEGVWALEVASDGTYSTSQPITRDVCTNVESITQLDSSVLFVTDRGIMELAGSRCACISEAIESEFGEFDLTELPYFCEIYVQYVQGIAPTDEGYAEALEDFKAEMQKWAKTRFFDFIRECRILYDYVHQRIIVYNATSSIGYNYSLKDKEWGLMFTNLRYTLNSYPEAYALSKIDDADYGTWCNPQSNPPSSDEEHWELMDMSTYKGASDEGDEGDDDPDEETETMMFVTRPLKFDMPDIWKTVRTVVQRGYFQQSVQENHIIGTVLYGSPDLFNWYIVGQSLTKEKEGTEHLELTAGHVIDNELGSPYKYFRVMVVCRLRASESVYGLTALFERKDDNTLR